MRNLSMTCNFCTDLRGYIDLRASFNVFGRKKWTFLRTLVCFFVIAFLATFAVACAFATLAAFSAGFFGAPAAGAAAAFAAAFGAGVAFAAAFFGAIRTERELE